MKLDNTQKPSVGRLQRILWWASGATSSVLVECPTEHKKYAAIGTSMMFISVVAATGAGFALQQSYGNNTVSIIGGIAWGALIFSVDRLIQISIRKDVENRKAFWMALPRLLMIVVLSFLITDPLLHKFFEKDIDYELRREAQMTTATAKSIADARDGKDLTELENANQRLSDELGGLKTERDKKFDEWMAEGAGTGGTHIRGKGTFYMEKERAYEKADREYQDRKTQIQTETENTNARISELKRRQDEELATLAGDKANAKGLLARNGALFSIIRHDPGAAIFAVMLILAFILLESTPLTIKLVSKRGPYDKRFDREEQEQFFTEDQILDERKKTLQREANSRLKVADKLIEVKEKSLERIAKILEDDDPDSLNPEDIEVFDELRSYAKTSILASLPKKQAAHNSNGAAASPGPVGSPASLLVHLSEPEEKSFCLNINQAEEDVTGRDLIYALRGVEENLLPREGNQPPLSAYRVVNESGEAIDPDQPLFSQLTGSRLVNLILTAEDVSTAEH
ncbi:MAG TPA: hypothetical protein DC047_06625 [Blastocatellia bacterium]|nr:hypothetical protein [Blastocatellia bacterium]